MARKFSGSLKAKLASALSSQATQQQQATAAAEVKERGAGTRDGVDAQQPAGDQPQETGTGTGAATTTSTLERAASADLRGDDAVPDPGDERAQDDDDNGDDDAHAGNTTNNPGGKRRQSFASTLSGFKTATVLLARRSVENLALSGGASSKNASASASSAFSPSNTASRAHSMRSASVSSSTWAPNSSAGTMNSNISPALLTLQASNASLLECDVRDAGRRRLYAIDTHGLTTTLTRLCTAGRSSVHVGSIKWPGEAESRSGHGGECVVQMDNGRQRRGSDFLRSTKLMGSRKFTIPHYPHTMKWRKSGTVYKLISSGSKKVVALLEPAVLSAPPRIRVYDFDFERDESRPVVEFRGVPALLLDYILITALLLVTEKEEWLDHSGRETNPGDPSTSRNPSRLAVQSWRNGVETEPSVTTANSRPSSPATMHFNLTSFSTPSPGSDVTSAQMPHTPLSAQDHPPVLPRIRTSVLQIPTHPFAEGYSAVSTDSSGGEAGAAQSGLTSAWTLPKQLNDFMASVRNANAALAEEIRRPGSSATASSAHTSATSASVQQHHHHGSGSGSGARTPLSVSMSASSSSSHAGGGGASARPFRPLPIPPGQRRLYNDIPPVPPLPQERLALPSLNPVPYASSSRTLKSGDRPSTADNYGPGREQHYRDHCSVSSSKEAASGYHHQHHARRTAGAPAASRRSLSESPTLGRDPQQQARPLAPMAPPPLTRSSSAPLVEPLPHAHALEGDRGRSMASAAGAGTDPSSASASAALARSRALGIPEDVSETTYHPPPPPEPDADADARARSRDRHGDRCASSLFDDARSVMTIGTLAPPAYHTLDFPPTPVFK